MQARLLTYHTVFSFCYSWAFSKVQLTGSSLGLAMLAVPKEDPGSTFGPRCLRGMVSTVTHLVAEGRISEGSRGETGRALPTYTLPAATASLGGPGFYVIRAVFPTYPLPASRTPVCCHFPLTEHPLLATLILGLGFLEEKRQCSGLVTKITTTPNFPARSPYLH